MKFWCKKIKTTILVSILTGCLQVSTYAMTKTENMTIAVNEKQENTQNNQELFSDSDSDKSAVDNTEEPKTIEPEKTEPEIMGNTLTEKTEPVTAKQKTAKPEECRTPEELRRMLTENDGKTVVLTGDIVWENMNHDWLKAENNTTVDMNGYSLIIQDNAGLMLSGPIHFAGNNQGDNPVIVLGENSGFQGENGVTVSVEGTGGTAVSMCETSSFAAKSVTAYGEGSTAVYVSRSTDKTAAVSVKGDIIVSGNEAAAIETKGNIYLYYVSVIVSGENSVAVRTDGNVYMFFSEVDGEELLVDTVGEVVFDTCEVTPEQNNTTVITRKAIAEPVFITVLEGENYSLPEYVSFSFESYGTDYDGFFVLDTESVYSDSRPVKWDTSQVDANQPGIYTATATPSEYEIFSSLSFEPIIGSIQIVDRVPEIKEAFYVFQDMVLKMDMQIPEGIPVEVRYKMSDETEWNNYQSFVSDGDRNTIILHSFGDIAGREERKIVFCIRFTLQSGVEETSEFLFAGKPFPDDGGGDRDGGDQNDQGDRKAGNNEKDYKPNDSQNSGSKSAMENGNKADSHISGIFESFAEAAQQFGDIFKSWIDNDYSDSKPEAATEEDNQTEQNSGDADTGLIQHDKDSENYKTATETENTEPVMAPVQPEQKKETPEKPAEEKQTDYGDNTVLTGEEISYLIRTNPRYITIAEKNIRLILPVEAVKEISLSDTDELMVKVYSQGKSFYVNIFVNKKEIVDWKKYPLYVYIPNSFGENVPPEDIYCYRDEEHCFPAESAENGEIRFAVSSTGEYKISVSDTAVGNNFYEKEETGGEKEAKSDYNLILITAVCLLIGFGIFCAYKRLKR
ncbi:Ig-like domain-containing protein [Lachnospiraceae bacterium NSJ-143]|nr:Ig-like domain-containing protein [Lachnospiraceae bacterium NSJ-143]